jgi:hypothetical protein
MCHSSRSLKAPMLSIKQWNNSHRMLVVVVVGCWLYSHSIDHYYSYGYPPPTSAVYAFPSGIVNFATLMFSNASQPFDMQYELQFPSWYSLPNNSISPSQRSSLASMYVSMLNSAFRMLSPTVALHLSIVSCNSPIALCAPLCAVTQILNTSISITATTTVCICQSACVRVCVCHSYQRCGPH